MAVVVKNLNITFNTAVDKRIIDEQELDELKKLSKEMQTIKIGMKHEHEIIEQIKIANELCMSSMEF